MFRTKKGHLRVIPSVDHFLNMRLHWANFSLSTDVYQYSRMLRNGNFFDETIKIQIYAKNWSDAHGADPTMRIPQRYADVLLCHLDKIVTVFLLWRNGCRPILLELSLWNLEPAPCARQYEISIYVTSQWKLYFMKRHSWSVAQRTSL